MLKKVTLNSIRYALNNSDFKKVAFYPFYNIANKASFKKTRKILRVVLTKLGELW